MNQVDLGNDGILNNPVPGLPLSRMTTLPLNIAAEPLRVARSAGVVPEHFSVYLDLIRWVAAMLVILYHLREHGFGSNFVNAHLPGNGHAYVTIFFVLSGFVISYANDRKFHLGPSEYVKDRVARIYSVAIPVLALCLVVAYAFPGVQSTTAYSFAIAHPFVSTLINALFLGNVWFWSLPPFLDGPYWSLSYEVLYYVAFGVWMFARSRMLLLVVVALVAGPKIILLFPCWLIGVLLNRVRDRWRLSNGQAIAVAVIALAAPVSMYGLGLFKLAKDLSAWVLGTHYSAYSNSVNFTSDYLTAIAFAAHLYGMYWLRLRWPSWFTTFARWGASISFSLYLFHMPIVELATHKLGTGVRSNALLLATVGVVIVVCHLLAVITERKRLVLKRYL